LSALPSSYLHILLLTIHPSFFYHHPPPSELYTLSLHDALPIFHHARECYQGRTAHDAVRIEDDHVVITRDPATHEVGDIADFVRSEEHTSELQSLAYLVCRLLL